MSNSYFRLIDETGDQARFNPSPHTVGPWSDALQHGGPPTALAVACADRTVRKITGRTDLSARRLAADFVGPVPVAELAVTTRLLRVARSAVLAEVLITSDARECLNVRVWFVRDGDTGALVAPPAPPVEVPDDAPGIDTEFGYGASIEWRFVHGAMRQPGPGAAWTRPRLPLVDDRQVPDLARVALVADSASGVSAELDWSSWSFVNVDLDVHLARPLHGEWILLDAATQLGERGSAVARSTISDVRGVVGAGLQTLVVAAIPTR